MTNQHLEHEHEKPDDWFRHSSEEGAPQGEHGSHASARALAITFIAMTLGVAFTIVVLIAFFNSYSSRFKESVQETTTLGNEVRQMKATAQGELQQYGWVDHDRVQIPIDKAMKEVVAEKANGAG